MKVKIIFKIQYGQIYRADYNVIIGKRSKFKIQYGQIYSFFIGNLCLSITEFKIQYGQIYRDFLLLRYPFAIGI